MEGVGELVDEGLSGLEEVDEDEDTDDGLEVFGLEVIDEVEAHEDVGDVRGACVWRNQVDSSWHKVYVMFHSTNSTETAMNIMLDGFHISSSDKNMLGAGVYVSRSLRKTEFYGPITFKLLVYTGRVQIINRQNHPIQKSWQQDHDCAWVPPKCGMVRSGREVSVLYQFKAIKRMLISLLS